MAAGTLPMNGTDIVMSISEDSGSSYDIIGKATMTSLSSNVAEIDVTTKDSSGRKEIIPGTFDWSMTLEGLVTYNSVSDVDKPNDLFALHYAKTLIKVLFGPANTGEYDFEGDCYITSYALDAGTEEAATFSATFTGTGALTQAIVS